MYYSWFDMEIVYEVFSKQIGNMLSPFLCVVNFLNFLPFTWVLVLETLPLNFLLNLISANGTLEELLEG